MINKDKQCADFLRKEQDKLVGSGELAVQYRKKTSKSTSVQCEQGYGEKVVLPQCLVQQQTQRVDLHSWPERRRLV